MDRPYVHPELVDILAALPERPVNPIDDIEAVRAGFRALMATRTTGTDPRLSITHATAAGPDTNPLHLRILRPAAGPDRILPAVLYLHGGHFAYGELDLPHPGAAEICARADTVVIEVHYRLIPEHPFPAGIEDCYAALLWTADQAERLGVDPDRIAVTGTSAGGCLAAALCLLTRDRHGPPIAAQSLLIPVLDDRMRTASITRITDRRITNGPGFAPMWQTYLGSAHGGPDVSPYAAPARADDLSGLPQAYIQTCGLDPLRDEGLDYARRLTEADVPVELKDIPGAWHLFDAHAPASRLAARAGAHHVNALRSMLHA